MLVREFRRRIRRGFARVLRADCVPHAERRAHLLGALFWGASTEIRWDDSTRMLAPLDEGLGRQVDQWQPEGRQRQRMLCWRRWPIVSRTVRAAALPGPGRA